MLHRLSVFCFWSVARELNLTNKSSWTLATGNTLITKQTASVCLVQTPRTTTFMKHFSVTNEYKWKNITHSMHTYTHTLPVFHFLLIPSPTSFLDLNVRITWTEIKEVWVCVSVCGWTGVTLPWQAISSGEDPAKELYRHSVIQLQVAHFQDGDDFCSTGKPD